jgi:transposase
MDEVSKIHVGLDVHKDTIVIGVAEPGREPGRLVAKIGHDVSKLLARLNRLAPPERLHIVYEAGPTGFGLARALRAKGYACDVIAPSKMPRKPGDRIKTDERDCIALAQYSRSGDLHAVWIPDVEDEAVRDLSRAREDAVKARMQARHQLKGFLLRHDLRFTGKTQWGPTHRRWLAELKFDAAPAQVAFTEYCLTVQAADQRVERMSLALKAAAEQWRFASVVAALQALRGVALTTAIGLVAELGDLGRFEHPRRLMSYLGLVPSEYSSGEHIRRGSITKAGNSHARRLLAEAAWHYRFGARVSGHAQARQEGLSAEVCGIAWKAQLRLTRRFAALNKRGVQVNKVCIAVARELAGFVWAVGRQAQREAARKSAH